MIFFKITKSCSLFSIAYKLFFNEKYFIDYYIKMKTIIKTLRITPNVIIIDILGTHQMQNFIKCRSKL